ncbi:hypothetical protein [Streptomyces sp. NPDC002851]
MADKGEDAHAAGERHTGERGTELLLEPGPAGRVLFAGGLLQCAANGGSCGFQYVWREFAAGVTVG